MMLPTTGPTTSLMEDLQDLGLVEGNAEPSAKSNKKGDGYAQPDDKGGDYAGPGLGDEGPYKEGGYMVNAGDSAGGPRMNVGVRADGNLKVGATAADIASDVNYDDYDSLAEGDVPNGKMVPSFLIPTEQEVFEAEEQAAELAEEDRLNRAWEVINTYFTESDDGLNEEGLRGVINAMGYALNVAVEDIANLTVENERMTEAVNELTGLLYEAELAEAYSGKMDYADDDDDDDDKDDDEGLPAFLKKMKKKKDDDDDDMEESYRYAANLTEDRELATLASELGQLGESRTDRALDRQYELIEAFETVRDTCSEIVERIIDVIAEDAGLAEGEEIQVYEDDERVQVAQFFESIVNDAARYLGRLTDGDVPFRIAEADLSKLYGDMEKGIDAMHTVE